MLLRLDSAVSVRLSSRSGLTSRLGLGFSLGLSSPSLGRQCESAPPSGAYASSAATETGVTCTGESVGSSPRSCGLPGSGEPSPSGGALEGTLSWELPRSPWEFFRERLLPDVLRPIASGSPSSEERSETG
ncbi:hypothetical protein AAFF_G00109730 [Aldrovandia affinis]|uniref:Uncharacterized protein n=1 Tax=Aldrovandia affinis TaxID=143900 RepID=A0AAD7RTS5_9TELE|nr:hypothetical protein AAFF_G00109730 [Aldrovandia affinis]